MICSLCGCFSLQHAVGAVKAYHCDCLERVLGEHGGPEAAVAK